jgi:3-oxoacyl-[acyl-carrier protein] reductase
MEKHFVVAGGSHGIGLQLVETLISQGHSVTCISRTAPNLSHSKLQFTAYDFTSPEPIPALPAVIHGVAYCPGSINLRMFKSLKEEDFQRDFQLNVLGAVRLLQAALAGLKSAEKSAVVLFSTVAVAQGMAFHSSIAMAKGAIEGLTRSLAAEWAPNIRVNAIAPSLVQTPLSERLIAGAEKAEAAAKRHPLGRFGQPQDISYAASFLLGEESGWITGQVLGIDGGLSRLR